MSHYESFGYMAFRPGMRHVVSKDQTAATRSAEFRDKINRFTAVHTVPVTTLDHEARGLLSDVLNTMKAAEGKPEYNELYSIIQDVFSRVKEPLEFGTVGAALAGCAKLGADGAFSGCSTLCANAIQAPPSQGGSPCEYTVIYCSKKGQMQIIEGSAIHSKGIVYIIGQDEFAIDAPEYRSLARHGFQELKVIHTTKNGTVIKHITGDKFVNVNELIMKCGSSKSSNCNDKKEKGFSWGWILFVLLLLLVLGLIIYFCCCGGGSNECYDTVYY